MLSAIGLPKSTFLGWAKEGVLSADPGGAYSEGQVVEVVLLAGARAVLSLADLAKFWPQLTEEGAVGTWLERALELADGESCDLVIDPALGDIHMCVGDMELARVVRKGQPRPLHIIDLSEQIAAARRAFKRHATNAVRPTGRKVGRPAKTGNVRHLRSA